MRLVWPALALADRDGIFTHIEVDNPAAAIAVDERIAASSISLKAGGLGASPEPRNSSFRERRTLPPMR